MRRLACVFVSGVLTAWAMACAPPGPIEPAVPATPPPSPTPLATPIAGPPTTASGTSVPSLPGTPVTTQSAAVSGSTATSAPAIGSTVAAAAMATLQLGTLEAGMKVDVGGYQLYVRCAGQGRPTAVFDAGASSGSSA